jgi:hypothetical protein
VEREERGRGRERKRGKLTPHCKSFLGSPSTLQGWEKREREMMMMRRRKRKEGQTGVED